MHIRGEIRNFPFYIRERRELIFRKFVVGLQYLTGLLSAQISSNEFTEGMRFNLLQETHGYTKGSV